MSNPQLVSDSLKVVVAHKSRQAGDQICRCLETALLKKVFLWWEEDLEIAVSNISKCDLAVISADLSPQGESLIGQRRFRPALELLRKARAQGVCTPVIVISSSPVALRQYVLALGKAGLAGEGSDSEREIGREARALLGLAGNNKDDKQLELELDLTDAMSLHQIKWKLRGVNFPCTERGTIVVKPGTFGNLREISTQFGKTIHPEDKDWKKKFQDIGESLSGLLLKNFHFFSTFYYYLHRVESKDRVRIRFVVEKEVYPILLESLLDLPPNKDYWVLQSPVYRQLSCGGGDTHSFRTGPISHGRLIVSSLTVLTTRPCPLVRSNLSRSKTLAKSLTGSGTN